jgi:outer membrane protein
MKKTSLIFLLAAQALPAFAQISVQQCIEMGLANNPAVKIAEEDISWAAMDVSQARATRLPSLDASGAYRHQSDIPELTIPSVSLPFSTTPVSLFPGGAMKLGLLDTYDMRLTVAQPIFSGFRLSNRLKASRSSLQNKQSELRRLKIDLVYKIESAYANVLRAQKLQQSARTSQLQLSSHLQDVQNLLSQGMAKTDERLKVQVRLSECDLAMLQAENAGSLARVALENLVGRELPSDSLLPAVEPLKPLPELKASLAQAMIMRPELSSLNFTRQGGEFAQKIAKGALLPSLAGFATLGYGKPGLDYLKKEWMDYWLVGVSAEWNLWNWGKTRSQVEQVQSKINSLDEAERQLKDAITLDVTQACLQLQEVDKRIQVLQHLLEQAGESYRVAQKNYLQGTSRQSDFLDAQTDLSRAQIQAAQAAIDYALAWANWRRAVAVIAAEN